MATLEHLRATGQLIKHKPALERDEMPSRVVYFSPGFDTWLKADLMPVPRLNGRATTPYEQAEQALYEFIIGRPLAYDVTHRKLDPHSQHVWEFKPPDVRLFGWPPQKGNIVLVRGALKKDVPKHKFYAPYITSVCDFRTKLDLDEPKSIEGTKLNVVF